MGKHRWDQRQTARALGLTYDSCVTGLSKKHGLMKGQEAAAPKRFAKNLPVICTRYRFACRKQPMAPSSTYVRELIDGVVHHRPVRAGDHGPGHYAVP